MSVSSVGVEWVAAFLAPWTISPHPNFSADQVTEAQGLALVTERRERDHNKEDAVLKARWSNWGANIVEAARRSLVLESQLEATEDLWTLSRDRSLTAGCRIAAAAYAALGSLELDCAFESVDRLGDLFDDLRGHGSPADFSPSMRLAMGVLAQQRVVRAQDSSRHRDASAALRDVRFWLPRKDAAGFETFAVSRGISWGSVRVQRDIITATKQNALSSKASLEQFDGDAWVQVVRSRSGWIDLRHYVLERNRNAAILRQEFEAKFESTSGKRVFMRESTTDVAYTALLAAELSGDSGRAQRSRAEMAKVHLLAVGDAEFHSREALRLLRQAHATAPLKSAISWIRAEGPLAAMRDDALAILERGARDSYISESDILVLEGAADLLKPQELASAITMTSIYLDTQRRAGRYQWPNLDHAWKAVVRLLPGSNIDDEVAKEASELLHEPKLLSQPLTNTISRLVSEIDWKSVSPNTRDRWRSWALAQTTADPDTDLLVNELHRALGLPDERVDVAVGLEAAAVLADDGLPRGSSVSKLSDARQSIVAALRSESESAANGSFSFGGMSPSNVAVAFALRFRDEQVWDAVVQHLLDKNVVTAHKELALDRLAYNASRVPIAVRGRLSESWVHVAESARDSWMGGDPLPVFPQAIRMAAAFGALTQSQGVEAVLKLASASDPGKMEASRSMKLVVGKRDATWAHVLLLQLSQDQNPNVRAEAGFAMVQLLANKSSVGDMVTDRIRFLLDSDGVRCALRVIHGLQASVESSPDSVLRWLPQIRAMAKSDSRRVIRGAAENLLRLAEEDVF